MEIINYEELRLRKEEIQERIEKGEVFIYPTDTIYGLGCDASNSKAVKKIRAIKQRPDTPFSVIAPSVEWIRENCVITKNAEEWLGKLPGPLTLIMKLKNPKAIAPEVIPKMNTLGVRIPRHWISGFVSWLKFPIVTTSVNVTDQDYMTSMEDLNEGIEQKVNFAIYEGEKQGRPSKIVDIEEKGVQIIER